MKMNLFRKSSFVAALAATMMFASCSSDDDNNVVGPNEGSLEKAYMSINVAIPHGQGTRVDGSTEKESSTDEGKLNKVYVVTFDEAKTIIAYKGEPYVQELLGDLSVETDNITYKKSDAIVVSGTVKTVLVIANPGAKMDAVLDNVRSRAIANYTNFNAAIADATVEEVTGSDNKNFTMISYVDADATNDGALVDVADKIQKVGTLTEAEAKAEAEKEANRATVNIERLSSKVSVKPAAEELTNAADANAKFKFEKWALDVTNTTFFPYATKVWGTTGHTTGFYNQNFYTTDPNYVHNLDLDGKPLPHASLTYNKYNTVSYASGDDLYCIENTMIATAQKHQNATHIVVKGYYTPDGYNEGEDWFEFAGTRYQTLANLITAYTTAKGVDPDDALVKACDNFFTSLVALATADGVVMTASIDEFSKLDQAELDKFDNGGEASRTNNCIKWYKKGQCYYYAAIQHDNTKTGVMQQGKYGTVRNNWYEITVASVSKVGTPWYPNLDPKDETDPDPETPDPEEDIDKQKGYLGLIIKVAPWIRWENNVHF